MYGGRHPMATKNDPSPPQPPPSPEFVDGVELDDDDLDMVVGGLNPEASMAYAAFLRGGGLRPSIGARDDR
jgi:hypothetical protein